MKEQIKLDNFIEKKFKNITLETKVISYIIQKDHKISLFIDKDYFTLEPYQIFLEIIRNTKMEYPKQLFWQTVKENVLEEDDLEICKNYILKIYKTDLENVSAKNIEKLCNKLLDLQRSRKFMHAVSDTILDLDKFDLEKSVFKFRNILLNTGTKKIETIDYVENFENRKNHLKEIAKNPKSLGGIPTGIKEFDELTGGILRKEFGIIVAQSGSGKSVCLGNLGLYGFFKNYNVMIATFEMMNLQYEYRLDAKTGRIDYSKFRKSELNIFDYEKITNKMDRFKKNKNNFLKISHFQKGSTIKDIEAEAYKIQDQEEKMIDLLILDYINLVSASSNYQRGSTRDWQNQSETVWELKALCEGFNNNLGLPIWTANQLTDEGIKSKKITIAHMKYARGISEAAPIICALTQDQEAQMMDLIKLYIIKCRDFKKQKDPIILYPNFKYMDIDDRQRRQEMTEGKED